MQNNTFQLSKKHGVATWSVCRTKIIGSVAYFLLGLGTGLIPSGVVAHEDDLAGDEAEESQQSPGFAPPSPPVVDQSFTNPNDLGTDINEGYRFVGQIYTAGVTGKLYGVAVNVLGLGTFPLHVTIHNVTGGTPNKRVLAEATLASTGSSLDNVVKFSKAIRQVVGRQYAIVLDYPAAPPPGGGQSQGIWQGATGNLYPGGVLVTSSDGKAWTSFESQGFDLHFQTLVTVQRRYD